MNNIEIEHLSQEELIELHWRVCKRISKFNRTKLSRELEKFEIGEKVLFKHEEDTIIGTVIRVNKKSLSIKTEKGHWYVDPRFVRKFHLPQQADDDRIQFIMNTKKDSKRLDGFY